MAKCSRCHDEVHDQVVGRNGLCVRCRYVENNGTALIRFYWAVDESHCNGCTFLQGEKMKTCEATPSNMCCGDKHGAITTFGRLLGFGKVKDGMTVMRRPMWCPFRAHNALRVEPATRDDLTPKSRDRNTPF